ncbi:predicted protein [Chaetomium globosum CBS 148.51]|uniref:Uncharacterized protein n=1 Tax=Chaetomium globosum (strain ATCC 6205 / CBS 148.51 / DSM 1962 / NBRC 6347 / NRRL 1970) TaxID=306901 RepID=Q2H7B1_CHAGB|nr:uncharacterized protein CHGG_05454 [Chaetomium globosum CBS 148.51]EAQ88835.1 predicted protein [Chaetomium globosum CBS 148.51]
MTVTHSTKNSFRFGVEIELLLESPSRKYKTWHSLAMDLSKRLAKAGIPNRVDGSGDYSEWSIVREVTVQDPNGKSLYQYGIELISPIHTPATLPTLTKTLTQLFTTLTLTTTAIIPTPRCSSHIHISRSSTTSPPGLTPTDLAALPHQLSSRAGARHPHPARGGVRTAPHICGRSPTGTRTIPSLAALSLHSSLTRVDAAATAAGCMRAPGVGGGDPARPVVEVMNLVAKESRYGVVRGKRADFVRGKTCKWDFSGFLRAETTTGGGEVVDRGIAGTVEFRQPPGSVRAEEVVVWVTLAVAFVAGAVEVGMGLGVGGDVREEGGSLEELWGLLMKGREVVGWADLDVLEGLFLGVGR